MKKSPKERNTTYMQRRFESVEATSETSAAKFLEFMGIECSSAPSTLTKSVRQVRSHMPARYTFTREMEQMKVKTVAFLHYFHWSH